MGGYEVKLCLCTTDLLDYKGFINGNEYQYEFEEDDKLYEVYNENFETHWFIQSNIRNYFKIY